MSVAFAEPVSLTRPDGRRLWFDGNGKITAANGTYEYPAANAFSLVEVDDCPGSTPTCRAACLESTHRVLTADLRYVPLSDLKAGDRLLSFDATRQDGSRRKKYRTGTVKAIRFEQQPTFAVTLESGKVFYATRDHRWLIQKPGSTNHGWCYTDELRVGSTVPRLMEEWSTATTFEAGWLSGLYDGEGCLYRSTNVCALTLSQKAGAVLERAKTALASVAGADSYADCAQARDVWQLRLYGGRMAIAKVLGTIRPTRLLAKFKPEMLGEVHVHELDLVRHVAPAGVREIALIDVDCETMVVEGYGHHNCYVQGLRVAAPQVHAQYEQNSRTIRDLLNNGSYNDARAWAGAVAAWITAFAPGGFRWHVSGDIFSQGYAHWIADVVRDSPTVKHWIYTRSHGLIAPLVRLPNLSINLSADRDNIWSARSTRAQYRSIRELRIAYLVTDDGYVPRDLPADSVVFPDYSLRGRDLARPTDGAWWQSLTSAQRRMVCGVDYFGPSRSSRCGVCTKCIR